MRVGIRSVGDSGRLLGEGTVSERELIAIRRSSGKKSLIAKEDFDPKVHTIWEDTPHAVQEAQAEEVTTTHHRRGRPKSKR